MIPKKLLNYKLLTLVLAALLSTITASVPSQSASADGCSDVFTPLSSFVTDGVNANRSFYERAMNETGVPWEMLAAIHYRETNFSHTNPSNGQGIFQFANGAGGPYPAGPVNDDEFYRQLKFMANKLQSDYVWRGSVDRERRQLQPNEQNITLVKDTLFSYNGRSGAYAAQAAQYGYSSSEAPYEGSPYVMNRFDCQRDRMGIITTDGGSISSTDTRYGAFTIFARLRGDAYWQSLLSAYDWSIESFSLSGGDNQIAIGQTDTATLKARNTGRLPWYNHGDHPVKLGTWDPADRTSQIAASGWPSGNRAAVMQESAVQPGEVGTFTFPVTPTRVGKFVEAFNLVAENSQFMRWPGFSPTFEFTGQYSWKIDNVVYGSGTGLMEPGTTQLITVVARNTGSATWNKFGGAPIRMGTWEPQRSSQVASGWMSAMRAVDMNETTVAPGQTAGFQFFVRVPAVGNYYERMNLVAEGQTWMNDAGLTLYLRGGNYAWQPISVAHSTGTANITHSTDFTLTVKARNTGEVPWRKGGGYPVRFATSDPLDRGSALYAPSWLRDTRPASLLEDVVQPGQIGTFTFTAHTPTALGPRTEYFTPVAEGVSWFNDPGFNIYVNVQ